MKDPVYVSKKSVGRPRAEYIFPVELAVRLINEEKGMSRELIGADGEIFDFPGVEYTPRLTAELANWEIKPIVKYGEHIGIAGCDIKAGEHVHVRNVEDHRENLV